MTVQITYKKSDFDPNKIKEGKVRVGFFESAKYEGNLYVAQVARYNEFGLGVPRRSFMRPAIHENYSELNNLLRSKYTKALKDNTNTMNVLGSFGEHCKGLIQKQIIYGHYKPNAPSTIKRKGFNAPLRDTLLMLNSVAHQEEEVF